MSAPRRYQDIPGPRGVPFFGNTYQFDKRRVHERFAEWVQEYGPYVRVRVGPRDLLLVADHAVIGSVLRDRPERFRRPSNQAKIAREMGFGTACSSPTTPWRGSGPWSWPGSTRAHQGLLPFAGISSARLRADGAGGRRRRVIDLQADLMRYTVDAIAGLAFGADINTLESDEDVIQRHLDKIFPALAGASLAPVPYWRYVALPRIDALERSVRDVQAAIEGFIAEARRRLRDDPELRIRRAICSKR